MQNLEIKQTPAKIEFNYDQLKAAIDQELERYDIAVTEETLPDAKKAATELNALKNDIDKRRKEAVKAVSAPIKAADDQMKELVKLIESGRQRILEQCAALDQKNLDELNESMLLFMRERRDELGISEEFRTQGYADLVILSNRTKAGSIAGKAANEITARVQAEKQLQDRTERRLLELENHCYRAGLDAPLQRQHVEHFLFADDEQYGQSLEKMMQAELDRQKAASERRERIAEQAAPKAQPEPEKAEKPEPDEPKKPNRVLPPGKVGCTVTATFHINIHPDTPVEKIEATLRKNMEKAGITTLENVTAKFD